MPTINRRELGLLLAAGATTALGAGVTKGVAQDALPAVLPGTMSPDVQAKIGSFLLKQQMAKQMNIGPLFSGPNPDPDYTEFWAEARPKDPPPPPPNELVVINPSDPNCPPDYNPYANFKQIYANTPSWSEEGYFEITPDFADMYPPMPPSTDSTASNSFFTMNFVDRGKVVTDPSFYQNLLRGLDKKGP